MAWTIVNNRVLSDSDFSNMNGIRELLYIKHNFADMTRTILILYWSIVYSFSFFLVILLLFLILVFILLHYVYHV